MRSAVLAFVFLCSSAPMWSQAAKPATPPRRTPAAYAELAASSAQPPALLHPAVGTLPCKLFVKDSATPVIVFIGLATSAREWNNPVSHLPNIGVPVYV